jgi:DDE superfamily endonuclease/Helix-turn-helix of DDE superfamily endonuclease
MISVSRLRRKPRHFQTFTGLSVAQFDLLLAQLQPAYEATIEQHRARPDRHGPAGAGRPFRLALPERLLMGLMYLRLYVGQSLLSFLFDIDQSNVCRELNQRLLPVLMEILPTPLRDAPLRTGAGTPADAAGQNPPTKEKTGNEKTGNEKTGNEKTGNEKTGKTKRRINTLEALLHEHPEIKEVLIDATEQAVPQPEEKLRRKRAYSGKQHDHTIKTQIVATKELILHVFGGLPGCLHDQTLLFASGVLRQVPAGVKVRLDKGYAGTDTRYPAVAVQMPMRYRCR